MSKLTSYLGHFRPFSMVFCIHLSPLLDKKSVRKIFRFMFLEKKNREIPHHSILPYCSIPHCKFLSCSKLWCVKKHLQYLIVLLYVKLVECAEGDEKYLNIFWQFEFQLKIFSYSLVTSPGVSLIAIKFLMLQTESFTANNLRILKLTCPV